MTLALSLFFLGLAAGVHCVAMCGGFVAAFAGRRVIPVREKQARRPFRSLALFNAGRITSYAIAGAIAGTLGGAATSFLGAQQAIYVLANLMLIAIGLHLAGAARLLAPLEALGAPFWRLVQPQAAKAMNGGAYAAGLLWGWIPCGLVYGALAAAAFAGSAAGGAAAMAAYGLGTLPWLMAGGVVFRWLQTKATRAIAGVMVLAFGVYGLAHGADLRALLCL
ncbi:MAG TPA: sulfite exporter TauE/SafE family protein [Burkholderiales bacterium]|nr:sulfite exporter TauE/SafE family protein [Burkholderiales bacterium]